MVTMKIKRRIKDSSGRNDVNDDGVESNLNLFIFWPPMQWLVKMCLFWAIPFPMQKIMFGYGEGVLGTRIKILERTCTVFCIQGFSDMWTGC